MTLLKRTRDMAADIDSSDLRALRARIVDAVETAIDGSERMYAKAGDAMNDAPSAAEVAHKVRRTRAWELAGTAAAAAGPIAMSALQRRSTRQHALRAAKAAPIVVFRSHPVVLGFAAVGAAAAGITLFRRVRGKAAQDEAATIEGVDHSLAKQHERMDGEGPMPGFVEPTPGAAEQDQSRRFVRTRGHATYSPS